MHFTFAALPVRLSSVASITALAVLLGTSSAAWADRTIVDQLGREVVLADTIHRAVVLQHHTLDVIVQLDAQADVVGVVKDWQGLLGKGFARLAPNFTDLPTPGDLKTVNVEEVLSLKPDVVFISDYAPAEAVKSLVDAGLPVVQMAFFDVPESERGKLNPVLPDDKAAYTKGLTDAVTLVGEVFGKQDAAQELNAYAMQKRAIVEARTAGLPTEGRTKMYMANPDMNTYGAGKYTGAAMELAGGLNVAQAVEGYGKVEMEQVLAWNPDVIVVQDRYPEVVDQIRNDAAWATIAAVKNGRIDLTPEYVKPWGRATPESVALGEIWLAKSLHPDLFTDIDMDAEAQAYYKKFYRTDYVAAQ